MICQAAKHSTGDCESSHGENTTISDQQNVLLMSCELRKGDRTLSDPFLGGSATSHKAEKSIKLSREQLSWATQSLANSISVLHTAFL